MAVANGLLAAVAATGCGRVEDDLRSTTLSWRLTASTGAELDLLVSRVPCDRITDIEVTERAEVVDILVIGIGQPECEDREVEETVDVTLDAPLGDRQLRGCGGARGVACPER